RGGLPLALHRRRLDQDLVHQGHRALARPRPELLTTMKIPITIAALAGALGLRGSGRAVSEDPSLEEARLTMSKWIETQQIISKERNDWQQGKEILLGRLELVRKETSTL